MQGITNYLVIVITAANVGIGIFQEIRSKLAIDKLAIMASSSTKVVGVVKQKLFKPRFNLFGRKTVV